MPPPTLRLCLCLFASVRVCVAATDVKVSFVLNTKDAIGTPMTENRSYLVYRPDGLSKANPVPMVLVMSAAPGDGTATFFHRKADQAGFVIVSCSFTGNTDGGSWVNDNPRIVGFEDYDYISTVIARVAASDNCNDAFICGLSKGGHTSYAFACERPAEIRAACSLDEFMNLVNNVPIAPVPIMAIHGTVDTNVPYTMGKDSVDAWRAMDGLMGVAPVTTYESSPLQPGHVTQATWRGGLNGTQVAFVTIVGGSHQYPLPSVQTGYDCTDGIWAFFSQFLTPTQAAPKIVSVPVNNTQIAGQPASFWVSATGTAPLRYQWQKNGADIPGATANSLTIAPVSPADNGASFRAVVTNPQGTVTSPAATLTVTAQVTDPVITTQPADVAVTAGKPASFSVAASGTAPLRYRWRKNGMDLPGETNATLSMPGTLTADSGATFTVIVSGPTNSTTSVPAMLSAPPAPGAPVILTNPQRNRVLVGDTATYTVTAWSQAALTYQWQKGVFLGNMADIPGATAATYTTPAATLNDHLTLFRCVVSNAAGSVTSASEMLFVTAAATPPTDITSFVNAYGSPGAPFRYMIVPSGGTAPITFATTPLPAGLTLDANTGVISGAPLAEGVSNVTLTARNSVGSTTAPLIITINATAVNWGQERLANLATRGLVGPGEANLIAGFVVQGSPGSTKRVLVRAIGPGLAKFGVPGTLADPRVTVTDGAGKTVLTTDDWDPKSDVATVSQSVGAFPLDSGSKDAAAVIPLTPGNYSARVEGAPTAPTGAALLEVYDADAASVPTRQINLSTRGIASRDANQMIAGFTIDGVVARTVLIRAISGGTLAAFGINGGLADPSLEVYDSKGNLLATNDDWGRSRQADFLPQAFRAAGAFALSETSKDAAVLLTLPPGGYTAKVVNRDQPDGVALVEVYEAPAPP